jgi:hypothetical protein
MLWKYSTKQFKHKPYTCFLREDTLLPMIYMDDAIRATLELMEAPVENIRIRSSYNLAGVSFTPAQVTAEIKGITLILRYNTNQILDK